MILIRSPCRPRNTNRWPPLGDCFAFACRAMAERVLLRRLLGLRGQLSVFRGRQNPCACPSPQPPARPLRSTGQGSFRQTTDQTDQGPGIIRPADPKTVPNGSLDLDLAVAGRKSFGIGSGMTHNLDRQETRRLRRPLRRVWRKPCITHPFEDQIGIQPISPRNPRHGNIRRRRLKTDRLLLVVRPKPPRSTCHPKPNSVH